MDLNRTVRLRFADGEEYIVKIVEEKKVSRPKHRKELLIDAKTPLAQAILGHNIGEEIEFRVKEKIQRVFILEILYSQPSDL